MIEPLVKTVWVRATADEAFQRFTSEMGTWWPTATHSVCQDQCRSVHFEAGAGGTVGEEGEDGTAHVWGTVTEWDPPTGLAFTWHPGRKPGTAQQIEVIFASERGGTRVTLTHTGWDLLGNAAEDTRADYDRGWTGLLGLYEASLLP